MQRTRAIRAGATLVFLKHSALVALFRLGCVTGGVASQLVVPPAKAGSTLRWEYLCVQSEGLSTNEMNGAGAEGWEVARQMTFPANGVREFTTCFKRPL